MRVSEYRNDACFGLRQSVYDLGGVADQTWQAIVETGMIVEGNFTFDSGIASEVKVDFDALEYNPREYSAMIGRFAAHPCLENADLLLDVPYGVRQFTHDLATETGIDVVHTELIDPKNKRRGYKFYSEQDRQKAINAKHPKIIEDVVTTLGSVARLRALLPVDRTVHVLVMLLRGQIESKNCSGITTHYLLKREIPTTSKELAEKFATEWA